jgi:hypothetical protein
MKTKSILLMGSLTLFSTYTFAQTIDTTRNQGVERQATKEELDKQRLDNAVNLKKDTRSEAKVAKANAKKADRIEDDASDAARQAKLAARTEARAQRTREQADKQAKKAARANQKFNDN